jgi:hypothetical protein
MATKKKNDRRVLYARVSPQVFKKLERIAAKRGAEKGARVTLQDAVIQLIEEASAA